ncbi:MAG: rhodanese-like domain-containing protein [Bacteroidia bacterium]
MNSRQIISIIVLMLGTIAAILPSSSTKYRKFSEEELDTEINKVAYYVSTDELAHAIINNDPSIQLIDIRAEHNADKMIRYAVNIPADSILSTKWEGLLFQKVRKSVLYGDNEQDVKAAWKKLKYEGYPNIYMLSGGIQAWNQNILNPKFPGHSAPQTALDLYKQRIAAKQFFTGAKALPKTEFKIIIPAGGRKKKKVEGGCS